MQRKMKVSQNQKVTSSDINAIGDYARGSFDDLTRDAVDERNRYAGFIVVQSSASTVTVGAGRFYKNGEAYYNADGGGVSIDMLSSLPAVAKKIATIVAWGNTVDTSLQSREFLVDAVTRATEARSTATESRRTAYLGALYGVENATPASPAVPSDYVAVATVVLTPAGIESITMLTENQLGSVKKLGASVDVINNRLAAIGPELDTAKSNIAGLANAIRGKASAKQVREVALDLASVKDQIDLPADYTAWSADHLVDDAGMDPAFSGYSALVRLGGRYPNAAVSNVALALANALDPNVIVNDNMVMPAYTSVLRLSVTGKDGEYSLADTTIETTSVVQLSRTRTVRDFGECVASLYYGTHENFGFTFDAIEGVFKRGGETFIGHTIRYTEGDPWDTNIVNINRFTERTITEPYFDRIVTSTNVSGAILGQTFLQSSDGYLTKVGLRFTRKANAGDVRVAVCETNAAGAPDLERVVGQKVLANADILANLNGAVETVVDFAPIVLLKGRRYSVVLISNAAHFVAKVTGNKLASGSLFYSQDGAFVQRPGDEDMPMNLYFAEFNAAIVPVQLAPLELAGGIGRLRINADYTKFDGCRLEFQYYVGGKWISMAEDETMLDDRPSLMQQRVIFIGTKDIMPALGIGAGRSNVEISRPADTRTLISDIYTMPVSVDEVFVRIRHDNWSDSQNTTTVTLLVGSGYTTVETADATDSYAPPDDPNAKVFEYTFNLATPRTTFRIKEVGTCGDSHSYDLVRPILYYAFAA